jgi:hypothetical protein
MTALLDRTARNVERNVKGPVKSHVKEKGRARARKAPVCKTGRR